ncbi:MAG TPA: hypothetical protein VKZ63_04865, partial [Kofleriaceae bacterium]|nr:hypothetical protein [Kofleriaceae bacterium]
QNVIFTAEYNPIERLGLTLSLPLLLAKYGGDGSQFPRHGDWDDGDYHGSLQDLGLRARYMLLDAPVAISPHLGVTVPVSDYPTSGFANAGRHLVAGVVGASIGSVFAERVYVHLFYELGIPQKADDSEEHEEFSQLKSDIAAQLGVLVTPAIEVHLAVDWHLQHDGVAYSELTDPNSPLFLEHDRVLDEDWLYGGIGASWLIANQWTLGAEFRRYLTGSNTRKVTSLGVSLGYDFTL